MIFLNCFRFRWECLTYDSRGWHIFWHPEPLSRHSLQALFAKGGLLPRRSKTRLANPKYQAGLTINYFVPFLLATPSSLSPRPLKGFLSGLGSRTPFKDPQPCFASGTTVNIGFCDQHPSGGSRSLKPVRPLMQEAGYHLAAIPKTSKTCLFLCPLGLATTTVVILTLVYRS